MAEHEVTEVKLVANFYRDSFGKVAFVIAFAVCLFGLLIATSIYIFLTKPPPITFHVASEWRVQPPVPIDKPYLTNPDVLQWVSNVVPNAYDLDFMYMDQQLKDKHKYFTDNGYDIFIKQLNNYIDKDKIQRGKLFLNAEPLGAPFIINQGELSGRYAWWVQIPLEISYAGLLEMNPVRLTLQVLVVRTDTTNNLTGVLIDNVIIETDTGIGRRRT